MVRWSRDDSKTVLSQSHPLFNEHTTTNTRYFTTQNQHLFSASLLNMLRFAANRTARTDDLLPTVTIPTALYFSTDPHFGAIDITGVSTAGSIATTPVDYKQDVYQVSDTLTWNKSSHVIKTGFDLQDYHFYGTSYSRYGGTFRFNNLREFLTLQSGKQEVKEIRMGQECGLKVKVRSALLVGDRIETFKEERREKKLVFTV